MAKRNQKTAVRDVARLDARLKDYTLIAAKKVVAKSMRGRVGNWPIYAAAAGSALAMATSASANIIQYYGPSNNYGNGGPVQTVLTPAIVASKYLASHGSQPFVGTFNLDLSSHKFGLKASAASSFGLVQVLGIGKVHIFVSTIPQSGFAKKFASGSVIGSHAGSFKADAEVVRSSAATGFLGNFAPGHTGFAGLAVTDGNQKVEEYGWIRLEVLDGQNGFPQTLEAIDWAFNTTGNSIEAGEETAPAATPEPGTMGLSLLASGAIGVMALKRRRARKSAAVPAP